MARIELNDVTLTYRVRRAKRISLKEYLVGGMFSAKRNPIMTIEALSGLNLRVEEGNRLGIIGHNGAGKSSLLKLLAGVYPPTSGQARIEGRVSSLFDLTLGFEMDASGWDNIAFRGYLQGETPRTVAAKKQEIAEFSELGDFLDMPVRYYSSGMLVRLAFSIATAIEPEILLVDEVLAAGDLAFQDKAARRMQDLLDRARIIVMVSHSLDAIARICNCAMWLDHGRVRKVGDVGSVIEAYRSGAQCPLQQAA